VSGGATTSARTGGSAGSAARQARLREVVERLAALERPPCSPGEREAAEYLAACLREHAPRVRIEEERVHGSFHWVLLALGAIALGAGVEGLRGRRGRAALVAGAVTAAMFEDLGGGRRRWFRRHALPQRPTTNVIAECGDRNARRTLLVLAHHDAARTSFLFEQSLPKLIAERAPWVHDRMDRWPPLMWLVVAAPLLIALGALTRDRALMGWGTFLNAGTVAIMWDLGTNEVVPAANDNATACAAIVELARSFAADPPPGLRVVLLSAGAEEANQEGIIAFANRHFADLDPATTSIVCLDTLGSGELLLIEGEGFLVMRDYPADFKDRVMEAAREAGVHVRRGLRFSFATDGLIGLRAGYPTASIGSVNEWLVPSNYHWPTDTADRVDYGSVEDAVRLTERLAHDVARA
jgi:hypothetical protein